MKGQLMAIDPRRLSPHARPRSLPLSGLLLVLLGVPFSASQAAIRCINTEGDFKSQMDAAFASGETQEEVRIKQGLFAFSNGDFGYSGRPDGLGKTIRISGGWSGTPGNCDSQDGGPSTTVLWGSGQRSVIEFYSEETFNGTLFIENLMIGGGYRDIGIPTCLFISRPVAGGLAVVLDRIRVQQCVAAPTTGAAAVSIFADQGVVVRNSLFVENDAGQDVPVRISITGSDDGYILNNTFADNASSSSIGTTGLTAVSSEPPSLLEMIVANNVFDRNTASAAERADIRVFGNVRLINNRYAGVYGTPLEDTGSSTGSAGFSGDDYQLAAGSSARDAGAYYIPLLQGSLDYYGRSRVAGSAVDLGAAEFATLFGDGFESP